MLHETFITVLCTITGGTTDARFHEPRPTSSYIFRSPLHSPMMALWFVVVTVLSLVDQLQAGFAAPCIRGSMNSWACEYNEEKEESGGAHAHALRQRQRQRPKTLENAARHVWNSGSSKTRAVCVAPAMPRPHAMPRPAPAGRGFRAADSVRRGPRRGGVHVPERVLN